MPNLKPQWAPRLKPGKIKRLYGLDAQGIHDEALIDEVGYTLHARCQSILDANEATAGLALCPICSNKVPHLSQREETLLCAACGWSLPWADYFSTIQDHQLYGAGPVLEWVRDYVEKFPSASHPCQKMFLIDRLIHGFHWNLKYGPTRPVAVNLIQGRLASVIALLDSLSYGDKSTPGMKETQTDWFQKSKNVRQWARGN